ncbi:MAG: hypothetical protein VKK62_11240 [Synechococcaceae cyanobacterium]|jgi:hypothetical protein|nr:hypothetical protein [Synechococcaceae cyanobacterium]
MLKPCPARLGAGLIPALVLLLQGPSGWAQGLEGPPEPRAACGERPAIDRCLVGSWRQSSGGPQEWLPRNLPPELFTRIAGSAQEVRYNADGTFQTGMASGEIDAARDGVAMQGRGRTAASGRWSASGGRLWSCPDALEVTGRVQITTPDTSGSFATPPVPRRPSQVIYSCAGNTLRTTMPTSRGSITTTYTRVVPGR